MVDKQIFVFWSHIFTVESQDPEQMISGLQSTEETHSLCPLIVNSHLPVLRFQILIVLS